MSVLSSLFSRKQPAKPEPPTTWDEHLPNTDGIRPAMRWYSGQLAAYTDTLSPEEVAFAAFATGAVSTALTTVVYKRYFKRIPSAEWLTPNILARKRWIKGRVVR